VIASVTPARRGTAVTVRRGQHPADLFDVPAACHTADDPDVFFLPAGASATDVEAAKKICRSCQLVQQCAEWAIPRADLVGIWGATTAAERQAARVDRGSRR
jgi:WhiB family transcriptional regulator, redox-sensing transcriptional regulator